MKISYLWQSFTLFLLVLSLVFRGNAAEPSTPQTSPPNSPAAPKSLRLSDCIKEALKNNPRILVAKQNIEGAKGGVVTARSAFYPSVVNTVTLDMENIDLFQQQQVTQGGVIGFHHDWWDVVQITYHLYSAGVNGRQVEIAQTQDQIASLQLHEVVNTVIYDIQTAFYRVLVNQSEIEVRKQTVALLRKEVEHQKGLFEAGRATRFNITRAEVRLANEMPALELAETNLQNTTGDLLQLMGRELKPGQSLAQIQVSGRLDCPPVPVDADHWVIEGLAHSPELTREDKQILIAERQKEISRAALIPRLDLFAASRLHQKDAYGSLFDATPQTSFGISGTWNIFDGYEARGKTRQAEAQVKRETILKDAAARRIEYDVRRAVLALQNAQDSLLAQKGNVEKAEESVRLAQSSVEAGFATQFDVLQATVDLSQARNVELQTRQQYHQALAELEKATFARVRSPSTTFDSTESPLTSLNKIPSLQLSAPKNLRN